MAVQIMGIPIGGDFPANVLVETKLARPALAKSLRGWAVLPNPFVTASGRAARARVAHPDAKRVTIQ